MLPKSNFSDFFVGAGLIMGARFDCRRSFCLWALVLVVSARFVCERSFCLWVLSCLLVLFCLWVHLRELVCEHSFVYGRCFVCRHSFVCGRTCGGLVCGRSFVCGQRICEGLVCGHSFAGARFRLLFSPIVHLLNSYVAALLQISCLAGE